MSDEKANEARIADRLREQFEQLVRTGSVTTLNGKIVDIYSDENKKPLADE